MKKYHKNKNREHLSIRLDVLNDYLNGKNASGYVMDIEDTSRKIVKSLEKIKEKNNIIDWLVENNFIILNMNDKEAKKPYQTGSGSRNYTARKTIKNMIYLIGNGFRLKRRMAIYNIDYRLLI